MIKHIVLFKLSEFAEGNTKAENAELVKLKLESLPAKIEAIQSLEVGININESEAAYDVALITTHQTSDDLEAYMVHPEHQLVSKFIRSVISARVVADYIV